MENQEKVYDLEERTALFAERIRDFCLKLPKNAANAEYVPQLLRAGSSPGANYIEANESIGDKDFNMKIKTCRRESKGNHKYQISNNKKRKDKKSKETYRIESNFCIICILDLVLVF